MNVGVGTLFALASHKYWPIHPLHSLLDIPGLTIDQRTSAMHTLIKFALHDDALGTRKSTSRTVTWLLPHFFPLLSCSDSL